MNSRFQFDWGQIRRAWGEILGSGKSSQPRVNADLPTADADKVKLLMEDCLAARGGEVTARQRAAILGELYLTLSETGRRNFLETLVDNFYVDREQVKIAARKLLETADDKSFQRAASRMRET